MVPVPDHHDLIDAPGFTEPYTDDAATVGEDGGEDGGDGGGDEIEDGVWSGDEDEDGR